MDLGDYMATQTGSIDLKAQKEAHDKASQTASSFITEITGGGIQVHPASNTSDYTQIDANGVKLYKGGVQVAEFGASVNFYDGQGSAASNVVAQFGASGAQIGKSGESHVELDYHSLQLVDKEGDAYFHVSDLREADGYVTDTFVADGSTTEFDLMVMADSTNSMTVYVDDVETTSGITKYTQYIKFYTAPTNNAVIKVRYIPWELEARYLKAYSIGLRAQNQHIGTYSYAEGRDVTASGNYSHAEGRNTTASAPHSHAEGQYTTASGEYSHVEGRNATAGGNFSHAEGRGTVASGHFSHAQNEYTAAASEAQTAIGKYNVEDNADTYALIVGNGTSDSARSNAATIDWQGNYLGQAMAGIIQMFAGATPPAGWLVCDGSAVSRDDYAVLYAVIGDTWGAGDNSTTFNLPDLRGRAPIGAGTGSGLSARTLAGKVGAETHTLTAAQIPAHSHAFPYPTFGGDSGKLHYETGGAISGSGQKYAYIDSDSTNRYPAATNNNTGGGGSHNNMQPSVVVNFIICTGKTS